MHALILNTHTLSLTHTHTLSACLPVFVSLSPSHVVGAVTRISRCSLFQVDTPRRHRRNEAALESPEVKLARELRETRTTELKRQLEDDQRMYRKLTTDMIKADTAGEAELLTILADLEAWCVDERGLGGEAGKGWHQDE